MRRLHHAALKDIGPSDDDARLRPADQLIAGEEGQGRTQSDLAQEEGVNQATISRRLAEAMGGTLTLHSAGAGHGWGGPELERTLHVSGEFFAMYLRPDAAPTAPSTKPDPAR